MEGIAWQRCGESEEGLSGDVGVPEEQLKRNGA